MVEFWLNICKIRPRSADNRGRQINSFREGVERGDFKLMRTRSFVIGLDMSPLPTPDLSRFIGAPSKELKPYVGQDFTLATSKQYILTVEDKNLGNLTLYKADYCAAVITYHAMKGNKTALYNLSKFCSLGITKWIHGITGWQPQTIN